MSLDLRSPGGRRFVAVGVLTFLVYLAVLVGLEALGASLALAGAGGYLVAVPLNYLLHKRWTFQCDAAHTHRLPRYLASFGLGFVLNAALLHLARDESLAVQAAAQLAAILAVTLSNYLVINLWVFRRRR